MRRILVTGALGQIGSEQPLQILDRAQAAVALTARPYVPTEEVAWSLEHKLGVLVDGWYVPLATARPELLVEFEDELRREARGVETPRWHPKPV